MKQSLDRGTHVPQETQKALREELLPELVESGNEDKSWTSGAPIDSLVRTEDEGFPAAWVGSDGEGVNIVCRGSWNRTDENEETDWALSLRDSMYEDGEKALVGISGEHGDYDGDLIFRANFNGELLFAGRITDRYEAVDSEGGLEELPVGVGRSLFERLLDGCPKLHHTLEESERDSSAFVSDGDPDQPVPVFMRVEDRTPAAWTGGGALNGGTKGVVVCSEDFGLRKPLRVREGSGYVSLRQALVQVGQNDLIFRVDGRLPLERENLSLNVEAVRVEDPWGATSQGGDGTEEVPKANARRLFFSLLESHPEVGAALQKHGGTGGHAFVGEKAADPERLEGTVDWFDEDKGYGFLELGESDEDIFIHANEIEGDVPSCGAKVEFTPDRTEKGLRALDAKVL